MFIQSIDFDFWDIITDGPSVPSWRKDDENIVIKPKGEYTQDHYERLKKNSRVLYILQCDINDEIFNRACSCEIGKDELQIKCVNLKTFILKFSKKEKRI